MMSADEDGNNFELANDGSNFGAIQMSDVRVYNEVKDARYILDDYLRTRGAY